MILTYNDFIDSGMPTSNDIQQLEIEAAILTVEEFYLRKKLTDAIYVDLLNNPTTEPNKTLINGGNIIIDGVPTRYAGLKKAIAHLVFAYMLMDGYRLTRYGSVEKSSEYSIVVDRENLEDSARRHWYVGMDFVKEVMTYFNLDTTVNNTNDLFNTLLY